MYNRCRRGRFPCRGGCCRFARTIRGVALKRLVEPATLGDPLRPLIWVSKSLTKLVSALTAIGHRVCPETVRVELLKLGFSRQGNRKADEGSRHPDRDAQFEYINATVLSAQRRGQPVISVDTKKKELVGNFKNGGHGLPAQGRSVARERARLRGQDARQGRALRRLRRDRQRRLGERRDHRRHGPIRGRLDRPLARAHGATTLSRVGTN